MVSEVWLFGFCALLIILASFFSSAETSMMALNRYRVRHLARHHYKPAQRVQNLLEHTDQLLATVLIGNTCINILVSALVTFAAGKLWGETGVAAAAVVLTLVMLIFAEVMPKVVAAAYPEKIAFRISGIIPIFLFLLKPLVWLVNNLTQLFLKLMFIKTKNSQAEVLSSDELRTIVYEAGNHIPDAHKDMLLSILELEKVTIDHIMVPRQEIVGINIEKDWDEILAQLTSSQHTRLPIYRNDLDHVAGMIHLRSALNLMAQGRLTKATLLAAMQQPYFIPQGTPLNVQLLNFRRNKYRSALVVDEYGDLLGLVALEDILEEIVGEFTTNQAASNGDIHPQADGSYIIDGGATIREINRIMQWRLPERGPKTLSGLIIEYLEAIPPAHVCLKISGYPIEVLKIQDNMVKMAQVFPALRREEKNAII